MQYEFYYIDAILRELRSKKTISESYNKLKREELASRLFEVKNTFISNACGGGGRGALKQYFRMHQVSLSQIIDSIPSNNGYTTDSKPLPPIKNVLLQTIIGHCLDLTEFIVGTFSRYLGTKFLCNMRIDTTPKALLLKRLRKIDRSKSGELMVKLHQICIDNLAFKECIWSSSSSIQWTLLIDSLEEISNVSTRLFEEAASLFVRHDFNSKEVYQLICGFLDSELKMISDSLEQRRYLFHLQKLFGQAAIFSSKRFFKDHPKLGTSLIKFVQAEVKLIDHLIDVEYGNQGNDPFMGSFTVSLTVKQLAFFVFLQVETGILLTSTAKQVHQYFASRFSTLQGGTISEKSFKNAYYSHSSEDIKKVIEKLSQMLVIAEESY